MRLLFAGTPEAALPSLRALLNSGHEVAAVLTRPDAPAGRGRRVLPSAVADLAASSGVEILAPPTSRDPEFLARLEKLAPDCCPIVAYGGLVPPAALQIPPSGWVNLHFSLLPAWRGAAPVQRALLAGDDITGASTFRLVSELDAGPVYGCFTEKIRPDDTAGALLGRLAEHGASLLLTTLDGVESGALQPQPQSANGVSFAPKLTVQEAEVDWAQPSHLVDRLIRSCTPAPGAWSRYRGARLKIGPVRPRYDASPLRAAELRIHRSEVLVGTGTQPVELVDVQPQGKPRMSAAAWTHGLRDPATSLGA